MSYPAFVKLKMELCFCVGFWCLSLVHWWFTCSSRTSVCHSGLSVILLQSVTQLCSLPTVKNVSHWLVFSSELGIGFGFFLTLIPQSCHVFHSFSCLYYFLVLFFPVLCPSLPSSSHPLLFLSRIVFFFMYTRIIGLFSFQIQFLLFTHFHITFFIAVVHLLHVNTFCFVNFSSFLPVSFKYISVVQIQPDHYLLLHKALVPYISCGFGRLGSQVIESSFRSCYKTG